MSSEEFPVEFMTALIGVCSDRLYIPPDKIEIFSENLPHFRPWLLNSIHSKAQKSSVMTARLCLEPNVVFTPIYSGQLSQNYLVSQYLMACGHLY